MMISSTHHIPALITAALTVLTLTLTVPSVPQTAQQTPYPSLLTENPTENPGQGITHYTANLLKSGLK